MMNSILKGHATPLGIPFRHSDRLRRIYHELNQFDVKFFEESTGSRLIPDEQRVDPA